MYWVVVGSGVNAGWAGTGIAAVVYCVESKNGILEVDCGVGW